MKRLIALIKIISFFSIISTVTASCAPIKQYEKIGIYNNNMPLVVTEVELNKDTYYGVLKKNQKDSFKTLLINNMNQFAAENHLTLTYAVDYKFSIEDIDGYQVIKKFGIVKIDVEASKHSHKIVGKFKTEVNLVNKPKSINDIGNKIGRQKYDDITIDQTTFQKVIEYCLNIIEGQVSLIDNQAQAYIDYAVNIQGHKLTDKINKSDLGIQIVNINAIGDKPHPLLKGSSSFEIELIAK